MPYPLHWGFAALRVNHILEAAGVPVRATFPPPFMAKAEDELGWASVPPAFQPLRQPEIAHHAIGVAHA